MGEVQYFYEFYKTTNGIVGKRLKSESLNLIDNDRTSSIDAEAFLGVGNEDWMGTHTVRFFTKKAIQDIKLGQDLGAKQEVNTEDGIENLIKMIDNKESDQSLWVKNNLLTTRYDENTNQFWIDVSSNNGEGEIPRQQCSYIEKDMESRTYKLMECAHQWEYVLYPVLE